MGNGIKEGKGEGKVTAMILAPTNKTQWQNNV